MVLAGTTAFKIKRKGSHHGSGGPFGEFLFPFWESLQLSPFPHFLKIQRLRVNEKQIEQREGGRGKSQKQPKTMGIQFKFKDFRVFYFVHPIFSHVLS